MACIINTLRQSWCLWFPYLLQAITIEAKQEALTQMEQHRIDSFLLFAPFSDAMEFTGGNYALGSLHSQYIVHFSELIHASTSTISFPLGVETSRIRKFGLLRTSCPGVAFSQLTVSLQAVSDNGTSQFSPGHPLNIT
jgi:hypothetical protein